MIDNSNHKIKVSLASRMTQKKWNNSELTWGDFVERLNTPVKLGIDYKGYMNLSKQLQTTRKDVGGYVGGVLTDGKRGRAYTECRSIITLDVDFATKDFWNDFCMEYDCEAVVHGTTKYTLKQPRLRLIIPLARDLDKMEYEAVGRKIANDLDINLFDDTTFQPERFMFFPSKCSDTDWYFKHQQGKLLNPDEILNKYGNFRNINEWAFSQNSERKTRLEVAKQQDPREKDGVMGQWARCYTIQEAIAKFIPEIYSEVEHDRYTYVLGTTAAGLKIYNDGLFCMSYHSSDPAKDRLCNAFDLIRIHKFGYLDKLDKPNNGKMPSVQKMVQFAANDDVVKEMMLQETFGDIQQYYPEVKFEDVAEVSKRLTVNKSGEYESSAFNISTILELDTNLNKCFKYDEFLKRRIVTMATAWNPEQKPRDFVDSDFAGVRNYIDKVYGISSPMKIDDALHLVFIKNKFNPVKQYLESITWDGVPRIERLLVDYFGAEDNEYTRKSIRKWMIAAVGRIYQPGAKYDNVLTLVGGKEGTGKSTFFKKLGVHWFSDTFTTMQGKESYEQLHGKWIVEIAELSAMTRAEMETVKHFLSKCEDSFRPAYGRVTENFPRMCVFGATTNNIEFLMSEHGNRRFLPIRVNPERIVKDVFSTDFDSIIPQLWAEALSYYDDCEIFIFDAGTEDLATAERLRHSKPDERRGFIIEYLETMIPQGWYDKPKHERMDYFDTEDAHRERGTMLRQKVSASEIWCECFGYKPRDISNRSTYFIHVIMRQMPDWKYSDETENLGYGRQRYYIRKQREMD